MRQGKRMHKARKSGQNENQHNFYNERQRRPRKGEPMTENEKNETWMMCWEAMNDSPKKELHIESENKGEKPIEKMQKQKDEEEHVEPTLNKGN